MPFRRTKSVLDIRGALFLLGLLGWSLLPGGCARPSRPPGGPPDRIPPMVVSTWPEPFQTIEPTRDPVRIEFSERISERPTAGRLDDAVLVSPETSTYEVKSTRSGLEVKLRGGFRPGLVYRVRILNTIKDLFGNTMESPFEMVFSTGGEYEEHVLAGIVTDRITGEKVDQARVEARYVTEDSTTVEGEEAPDVSPYVARTDTAGIYLLRYVPAGRYEISIYQDNNRNREPDFRERQGNADAHLGLMFPRLDTIVSEVALLQPDTIPAQLIRVEAEDSVVLRIDFDDFLATGSNLGPTRVDLVLEEGDAPRVDRILWPHQMDSLRAFQDSVRVSDSLQIVSDSLRSVADSLQLRVGTLQAAGDTIDLPDVERELEALEARLAPPLVDPDEEEEEVEPPPPILPQSFLFALLREALEPNQPYLIQVTNVRNVNGLTGGGGETTVAWEPPEAPVEDTAAVDSLLARPDTAGIPPDTAGIPPGTAGIPRGRKPFLRKPRAP